MKSARINKDGILRGGVDDAMLIVDPARPTPGKVAAKYFRFVDTGVRSAGDVLKPEDDPLQQLTVVLLEP